MYSVYRTEKAVFLHGIFCAFSTKSGRVVVFLGRAGTVLKRALQSTSTKNLTSEPSGLQAAGLKVRISHLQTSANK